MSNAFNLHGRTALVTGAGSGIGRAIAVGLAEAGADVAVLGRRAETLNAVAEDIRAHDVRALVIEADVTHPGEITAAVKRLVAELGRLNILVNSAGAQLTGASADFAEADWDTVVDANLKGTFLCCQAAGRHFLANDGGKIINLASTFSFVGFPQFAAYCASKGGVLMLTKALASEWAGSGINVNAIGPCATRTEMNAYLLDDPAFLDAFLPRLPAGRIALPEDMVGAAVFLSSRASDMVHGHILLVDGGYTAL